MAPRSRHAIPLACLLACSTFSAGSRADDMDMARANQLLQEGQALKQQGKVEQGCRKIEESVGVRPGYVAELELADCHAALGRPGRAVQELSSISARAAARSKVDTAHLTVYQEYIAQAERRLKALAPKIAGLPRIAIVLSAEVLATPGLKVKLDGILVEPVYPRAAVAVDAGHHVVRVAAPGKRELTWEGDLTIGEKTATFEKLEDEAPTPAATPSAPAGPAPASTASTAVTAAVPPVAPPPRASSAPRPPTKPGGDGGATARDFGIVTGLVFGATGLGVGVGFAVAAGATRDDGLRLGCGEAGEPSGCAGLRSDYDRLVAGEVAGFVGAGLGLGLAGVLFFTRPARAPAASVQVAPVIGSKSAGLGVSGRF